MQYSRTMSSMLRSKASIFVLSAATSATLIYFLDARAGARRRSTLADKIIHWGRVGVHRANRQFRYFMNRTYGRSYEIGKSLLSNADEISDDILVERIRSKVGRILAHPKMLRIDSDQGRIRLSGYALTQEIPRLYQLVRRVRGVRSIHANNVIPVESERRMSSISSPRGGGGKLVQRLH